MPPSPVVVLVPAHNESVHLLPTIRSRCLAHALAWPAQEEALRWLEAQGQPSAAVRTLLRAVAQSIGGQ